jgi:2-polyprenyl-3-methyl-5-hydroxy-6-metoxy-1,4-benzoquinol methylase
LSGPNIGLATMTPAMTEARNYYTWMADCVAPAVGSRVLDVGGGAGSLLRLFMDRQRLYAIDIARDAVTYLRDSLSGHPNVQVVEGDVTDDDTIEYFRSEHIDTILCTNVLEHVEADLAMLRAFLAMLRAFAAILEPADGRLALLVPAHQWLYGSMDEAAGHFRRYTRRHVRALLVEAGFRPMQVRYMNSAAVLGWWFAGRIRKQGLADPASNAQVRFQGLADPASNAQVRFFDRFLVPVVRRVESFVAPPFGLSVLATAAVARNRVPSGGSSQF